MSTFLPKDYEVIGAGSSFLKLKQGDNKFRILTDAVVGKEGWKDGNPFRRGGIEASIDPSEVDTNDRGKPKIENFMAFYVYDYTAEKVSVFSPTQKSIHKELDKYASDEEWGHPNQYDLTITKSGEGLKTKYSVKPSPAKPLSKAARAVVDIVSEGFDLKAVLNIED